MTDTPTPVTTPVVVTTNPYISLFRHALTAVGSVLVTKGLIEEGMLQELIGATITFISVGWFWLSKPKA